MKVLFVTSSTTTHGGGSKSFLQMLLGLASYGIDPLVIFPDNQGLFQVLQQRGIACIATRHPYRMSVYPNVRTLNDALLFIPKLTYRFIINNISTIQLLKIAKQFRPDLIHSNVSVTAIGYYVARFYKLPHIWHIREYGDLDFDFHYYPSRSAQLKRYKQSRSHTICITKDIQRYNKLENWCHSHVIYNGILSKESSLYNKIKKNYFLFAGRLEKAKGILPLIDAYAEYCKKVEEPIPLYLAGSGTTDYVNIIHEQIIQSQIDKHVIFLGMRDDILTLYKDAKALIVPSSSEGFGRITAEAMFVGCLVIGKNTAGTKEQFDNGKEMLGKEIGLRYNNKEQLVQQLIYVTKNSLESIEPIILRGQQVAIQLYATEHNVAHVYNLYKQIVSK